MTHYICTACGGVSPVPGSCKTEGCHKHKQPLTVCDCNDPKHTEKLKAEQEKKNSPTPPPK